MRLSSDVVACLRPPRGFQPAARPTLCQNHTLWPARFMALARSWPVASLHPATGLLSLPPCVWCSTPVFWTSTMGRSSRQAGSGDGRQYSGDGHHSRIRPGVPPLRRADEFTAPLSTARAASEADLAGSWTAGDTAGAFEDLALLRALGVDRRLGDALPIGLMASSYLTEWKCPASAPSTSGCRHRFRWTGGAASAIHRG
jgi:hypothetical protein